jgi:outer membrane protein assembly factor BamB
VGARTGSTSQFFALNAATGARRTGGVYTGAPSSIGAINTAASVDYPLRQVYFASLEFPPDQPSLWCLELDSNGLGAPCWAPVTSPDGTSGSAVPRSGRLYVGDDSGDVWAFDTAGGTPFWGPQSGCGSGIKSFVLADRQGTAQDLYFSASAGVCAITDDGAPIPKWTITSIPNPSAPILARIGGVAYLYVGSTDGRLYQILADAPSGPNGIKSIPLRPGSVIGAPAFDVFANMVYVGSETGSVYAVQAPFP